jgi:hypothetical protein
MSEFTEKVAAMETILAGSTTFDRFLMDRAFSQLSGLDVGALDPKIRRKLDRVLSGFNHLAAIYPEEADPAMPLPATALVSYASIMQGIRDLAH